MVDVDYFPNLFADLIYKGNTHAFPFDFIWKYKLLTNGVREKLIHATKIL